MDVTPDSMTTSLMPFQLPNQGAPPAWKSGIAPAPEMVRVPSPSRVQVRPPSKVPDRSSVTAILYSWPLIVTVRVSVLEKARLADTVQAPLASLPTANSPGALLAASVGSPWRPTTARMSASGTLPPPGSTYCRSP